MKKSEPPVVVEEVFNASREQVWAAITDHGEMIKWYFDNIPDFKPEVGFYTEFTVNSGEREFLHKWTVSEVVPLKKISYNWHYKDDYEGDSYVHFEIFEERGQTRLRLSTEVIEDFSDDIPEFRRESCVGGWTYFINGNLKNYLDGKEGD